MCFLSDELDAFVANRTTARESQPVWSKVAVKVVAAPGTGPQGGALEASHCAPDGRRYLLQSSSDRATSSRFEEPSAANRFGREGMVGCARDQWLILPIAPGWPQLGP
jgi:hypothetical protein